MSQKLSKNNRASSLFNGVSGDDMDVFIQWDDNSASIVGATYIATVT